MPEVPLENAHETIEHHAHQSGEKWVMGVALSAAICAALAAITALLAEHHAQEAMLKKIEANDHFSEYQADSIKSKIIEIKLDILKSFGKELPPADLAKVADYASRKGGIKEIADKANEESDKHLKRHQPLSSALTMFQVAIAVGAISVLTKKKAFWFVSMVVGTIGIVYFCIGLMP